MSPMFPKMTYRTVIALDWFLPDVYEIFYDRYLMLIGRGVVMTNIPFLAL